jgi:hypothetical protein
MKPRRARMPDTLRMHRHPLNRRRLIAALAAAACAPGVLAREGSATLAGRLRFADVATARGLLMADDEWMQATGPFQRRAVMGSSVPVTLEAFRRYNGEAARGWSEEQRARWQRVIERIAPAFEALRIPLPAEVWLVATSGQESANAPYTRANAVMLPGKATVKGYTDDLLLAHEMWHVAARNAPGLATRLYAELGFEPVPELRFPDAWAELRIANPDAPANRHAMRLKLPDRETLVTPVLVATRATLEPGESFFSVMEPRLLELQPAGAESLAVLRDGQPAWHAIDGPHDYLQRLGGNTGYVIHHEEALADNVALLATATKARNPALLERLKAVLLAPQGA